MVFGKSPYRLHSQMSRPVRPSFERLQQEMPVILVEMELELGVPLANNPQVRLQFPWGKETLAEAFHKPRSLAYLAWVFREWTDYPERGQLYLRRLLGDGPGRLIRKGNPMS